MIPLMSCSVRDLQSYYSGCTVFSSDGTPYQVVDFPSNTSVAVVVDAKGTANQFNRKDLFVHYLEPFFSKGGDVHGMSVARSYKRAPTYDRSVYSDLKALVQGSFKSTFDGVHGRIGRRFFAYRDARLGSIVHYYHEPCGFFKDGTFYIPDVFLGERLRDQINSEGLEYVVQTV